LKTNAELPDQLLYKYRSCSERTFEIFTSRKLYFARAEQLNDPLDSQIDIQTEYSRAQKEMAKRLSHEDHERKAFLLFLLNSRSFSEKDSGRRISLNEALQRWIRHLGILSLSKNANDALLWAHYAAGHTGVCLGFAADEITFAGTVRAGEVEYVHSPRYVELFFSLVEELGKFVRPWEDASSYSDELGEKFYSKQITEITRENLFVKSEKWKYEEEFRIVLEESGLRDYDPRLLREIVFGTKAHDADIKRIVDILRTPEWQHVRMKKVRHVSGTFEFEVTDYES